MEVQEVLFQRAAPLSAAHCAFEQYLGSRAGAPGRQEQSLAKQTLAAAPAPRSPGSAAAAGAE